MKPEPVWPGLRITSGDKTVVAFDFETAPKQEHKGIKKAALDPHLGEIVGISLSVLPNSPKLSAIYIPLRTWALKPSFCWLWALFSGRRSTTPWPPPN